MAAVDQLEGLIHVDSKDRTKTNKRLPYRFWIELRQFLQTVLHLFSGSFKESTTTTNEQGITGKYSLFVSIYTPWSKSIKAPFEHLSYHSRRSTHVQLYGKAWPSKSHEGFQSNGTINHSHRSPSRDITCSCSLSFTG